jgi:hypothetical protein
VPCYTGTCPLSHMFVAAKHGFGVQGRSLQARGRTQRQPCFVWCQMPVPVPVQVGRRSQVCRRPVQRCTKQQSACLLLLVSLPPVALRKHAYKLVLPALLVVGGGGGVGVEVLPGYLRHCLTSGITGTLCWWCTPCN